MTQPSPTPDDVRACTCGEVAGEDWRCHHHGAFSPWHLAGEIMKAARRDCITQSDGAEMTDWQFDVLIPLIAAARSGWPADRERADRAEARVRELEATGRELLGWYGPFNPTKHPPEINGAWLRFQAALGQS